MISKNKNIIPKKAIIASVMATLLVLVIGSLTYVYIFNGNLFGWSSGKTTTNTTTNSVDYSPATTEQQQSGTQVKSSGSSDTPPTPTTIPGSDKKNVQIMITSAHQNGTILQIKSQIGAVEETGICTLLLTSTGQTDITKTANVQALANTSTCQGFDVPTSELSNGLWHISISYSSSTLTGTATQDVTINKS